MGRKVLEHGQCRIHHEVLTATLVGSVSLALIRHLDQAITDRLPQRTHVPVVLRPKQSSIDPPVLSDVVVSAVGHGLAKIHIGLEHALPIHDVAIHHGLASVVERQALASHVDKGPGRSDRVHELTAASELNSAIGAHHGRGPGTAAIGSRLVVSINKALGVERSWRLVVPQPRIASGARHRRHGSAVHYHGVHSVLTSRDLHHASTEGAVMHAWSAACQEPIQGAVSPSGSGSWNVWKLLKPIGRIPHGRCP